MNNRHTYICCFYGSKDQSTLHPVVLHVARKSKVSVQLTKVIEHL